MAPRGCQVCRHAERERIEALRAAGTSLDDLARKFGIDRSAISRHWAKHVTPERRTSFLCGAAQVEELRLVAARESGSVLEYLTILRSILMAQVVGRAAANDTFKVSNAAGRLLDVLKEIGHLTGEIATLNPGVTITTNVAVLASPVFLDVQTAILDALRPYPEARAAVIAALRGSEVARPLVLPATIDAERAVA